MANRFPKNNYQNRRVKTKNIITYVIPSVILFIICTQMLKLICFFRAKLNGTPNLIFVTPGELPTIISLFIFWIFSIIFIAFLIIFIRICLGKDKLSCAFVRIKNYYASKKSKKVAILYLIIILGLFDISVDYSVIYKDEIFHRSPIDVWGKYYEYSDIKEVNVSEVKGLLYYDLIMQDGTEINLTSIKSNYKFIPEVEDNIDNKVPHVVRKTYRSVLNENYLPHYVSKKFQIID